MVSDTGRRLIGALILTAVIIFVGLIVPLTLGLGTGEIAEQEVANQIDFYQKFYWSLIVIWAVLLAFIISNKNNKYGGLNRFPWNRKKTCDEILRKIHWNATNNPITNSFLDAVLSCKRHETRWLHGASSFAAAIYCWTILAVFNFSNPRTREFTLGCNYSIIHVNTNFHSVKI